MKFLAGLAGVSLVCSAAFAIEPGAHSLPIETRVAAQKAVEQVYWNHRIWPDSNPQPKPPLSTVMNDEAIRARVEDYLKKSNALATWWHRQITAKDLQAELDRMTRETRAPEVLSELYAALGNDPVLIAETLARPTIVERLIREMYASDARFHFALRLDAERALARGAGIAAMKELGGVYVERRIVRNDDLEGIRNAPQLNVVTLNAEEWEAWTGTLARQFGKPPGQLPVRRMSALQEDSEGFVVSAVLSSEADSAVVASVAWPKQSFDAWWSLERAAIPTDIVAEVASYTIATPTLSVCTNDTWETRNFLPSGRHRHAAVWTGAEMIIWGGQNATANLSAGGRYNPTTNSWTATSTGTNVPQPRSDQTAVWTGTLMIIWGGYEPNLGGLDTGARYDPVADSWTPISTGVNVPSARSGHTAVWTGTEMIVWGGGAGQGSVNTGGRYNPSTDSWTPTSLLGNPPAARSGHTAVWTGTEMIVWGGNLGFLPYVNNGARYNPSTNIWTTTSTGVNVPAGRASHTAVWTGTEMIVWGGEDAQSGAYNTGGRYDPSIDSWTPASAGANVPTARMGHTAVWTGTEMIIWGGSGNPFTATGGRYNTSTNSWTPTSMVGNFPAGRLRHTAVWTGTEMIVWGGEDYDGRYPATGGRYSPSANSWIATLSGSSAPLNRHDHSSVWTGAEMIVWGGYSEDSALLYLNSGGRYNPATNNWNATSVGPSVPDARTDHTAVWTGVEMLVWGGGNNLGFPATVGRYSPVTDTWKPPSASINAPAGRYDHTVVWTGRELIVWGGLDDRINYLNTGGRYDPATGSWTATPTSGNAPQGRYSHTAVWTGTEMIVWGGRFFVSNLNTGGRFNPTTNSWTPTAMSGAPSVRLYHTAVWTGTQMIVWGGQNNSNVGQSTGGRYTPSTDTWTSTSVGANVPQGRIYHTATWTGGAMIVWGGRPDNGVSMNTGGRYAPSTNSWLATSVSGTVPSGRSFHAASWTGTQLIVWGGSPLDSTIGLYCACPDGRLVYRDGDADGFGLAGVPVSSCDGSLPAGYVADGTDCDDANQNVHPGGTDACNGMDDDCDGTADNAGGALCDDGIFCTTDACLGAAGCGHTNNTLGCNDGNACTTNDTCGGGACVGGVPPVCNDGDPCTIDSCNSAVGCVATFSSGPCDDGNICTIGDTCATGVCTGPPNDGIACDDGSVCTIVDVCLGGSCSPGAVPLDCDDGNGCTTDSCGPVTGCDHVNNTNPCSDGDACTASDTCGSGVCHGNPVACSDGNPCTDDACNPATGACVAVNDDTNTCSDGNFCTQSDACQTGACVGSAPVACDGACPPGFTAIQGHCQRTYDMGSSALDNQTVACGAGGIHRYNNCNGQSYGFHWTDLGAGLPGVLRVDVQLESGVSCSGATRSVALNGQPVGAFQPIGSCSCSTTHGTVSFNNLELSAYAKGGLNAISILAIGSCEGLSKAATLDDSFARVTVTYAPPGPCQVGACVPTTGACSYSALPDGTACTDGSVCTTGDLCNGGICTPGTSIVCVDGNGCTTDLCDPIAGCVYPNNTAACDDGDACTYGDACAGGSCGGIAVPRPSETTGVTVGKSGSDAVIEWVIASDANSYDALRGDIAALQVGPGGDDEVCLGNTATNATNDSYVPSPDAGVWYLIRGVNVCAGSGTYGSEVVHGAPGTPRVSTTCP